MRAETRFLLMLLVPAILLFGPPAQSSEAGIKPVTGKLTVVSASKQSFIGIEQGGRFDRTLALTPNGISDDLSNLEGLAFVSIQFTLDEVPAKPAILISNPPDAANISINGHYVTSLGFIGPEYRTVSDSPKWLAVKEGILVAGKNEIKADLLIAGRNQKVLKGPIYIGDAGTVEKEWLKSRTTKVAFETGYLVFIAVLLIAYVFVFTNGIAQTDHLLFSSFLIINGILFFLDSELVSIARISLPYESRLTSLLQSMRNLTMLALVVKLCDKQLNFAYRILFTLVALFACTSLFLSPLTTLYMLREPYRILLTLIGLYYIYLIVESLVVGRMVSVLALVGVTVYIVASRADILLGTDLRNYSVAFFSVTMLNALIARHARVSRRLMTVSSNVLKAHEEERSRIARDIHDGIGQSLAGLKLRLQMLAARHNKGIAPTGEDCLKLANETDRIIEDVRRTAMDLRPDFMEKTPLKKAIEWHAGAFLRESKIKLTVHGGDDADLSPVIKEGLYRIVQEAISNAVKHSNATRMEISIHREGDRILLKAMDDGKGFDMNDVKMGLGLKTMSERAELLGGTCKIESNPGMGTMVTIEVADR